MGSEPFRLDAVDMMKIGKGAVFAMLGALAAYLAALSAEWKDAPGYVAITGAAAGVLANVLYKFVSDNAKFAFLAALLLPLSAEALEFTGPAKVPAGQTIAVELDGLPEIDLSKPFGDSLAWTTALKLDISAPEGDGSRPRQSLSIDFATRKWRMTVSVAPEKQGTYVLIAILDGELATHRVEVGAANPIPGPGPVTMGLRVLILTDEEAPHRIPAPQLEALTSPRVIETLNQRCEKVASADGKTTPAWRVLHHKRTPEQLKLLPAGFPELFSRGVAESQGLVPWVISTSPKGTASRAYPATVEEAVQYFQAL